MKKKSLLLTAVATLGLTAAIINPIQAQCVSQYLKFDGNDDWIDISNNGPMSNIQNNVSYTIEAWVKRAYTTLPGGLERIYSKDYVFNFRIVNDQFSGEIGNSSVTFQYPSDTLWHHIAFVRDFSQSALRLFIDGSLVNSSVDNSSTINNNNAMVCIGARNNGIGIYEEWKGGLKLIRVSNINRYTNSFVPNVNYTSDNNTLGFWPLNEGSGNIANDLSNNGHNGSINNSIWFSDVIPSTISTQPNNQTININNNAQFVVSSSDPSATYQWQTDLGVGFQNLNSVGQYSGTTNDTLTVSNVTMSNNNQPFRCIISSGSCSDTSNVAVLNVNNNVGINETSQDKLFSVFPNPAQSVINVKADSKIIGEIYSIYDNTGRVVLTGKLNAESTTIELGNLSSGIYLFSVGEKMNQNFRVIKE
jgi:hypothetical protein